MGRTAVNFCALMLPVDKGFRYEIIPYANHDKLWAIDISFIIRGVVHKTWVGVNSIQKVGEIIFECARIELMDSEGII